MFSSRRCFVPFAGIVLLAAANCVNAHGWPASVTVDGTRYEGWDPTLDGWQRPLPQKIIRSHIPNDSPVENWESPTMACNVGGEDGSPFVADVNAGATVSWTWNTWPTEHMGPMTIYAASCGGSCTTFKASQARWFALDKRGMSDDGIFPTDAFIAAGNTFTHTIPSNMAPGEYLIRMNIVALHSTGFPQFYPSCLQVRIHGTGNGVPSENELANIGQLDTGYENIGIWSKPIPQFRVPGPDVAAFVRGGNSGGQNPPPAPPAPEQPSLSTATLGGAVTGPTSTQVLGPAITQESRLCRRGKKNKKNKRALDVAYPVARAVEIPLPLRLRHEAHSFMRRSHEFHY